MNEDDIYEIAACLRNAIEEAVCDGKIKEMRSFPEGCCAYASDILQRYLLFEYDVNTFYCSGQYKSGYEGESHAWLETEDGVVIDITGDQYRNKTPRFSEPVYVGPRENGFHNKFVLDSPVPFEESALPFGVDEERRKRYKIVYEYIEK